MTITWSFSDTSNNYDDGYSYEYRPGIGAGPGFDIRDISKEFITNSSGKRWFYLRLGCVFFHEALAEW